MPCANRESEDRVSRRGGERVAEARSNTLAVSFDIREVRIMATLVRIVPEKVCNVEKRVNFMGDKCQL